MIILTYIKTIVVIIAILLFILIGVNTLGALVNMFESIKKYFDRKTDSIDYVDQYNKQLVDKTYIKKLLLSMDLSDKIMNSLTESIRIEVDALIYSLQALNYTSYNMAQFESDVTKISDKVFNAIKGEMITDTSSGYNSDYYMKYIVDMTTTILLVKTVEYNRNIYEKSNM